MQENSMSVTKRDGSKEPVDVNKIVKAVNRCVQGLPEVDAMRVAVKTISGLYDGATTKELDLLSIQTAASLVAEEPQYGKLGARLLATYIEKEVKGQEIQSFSQSVALSVSLGLGNERLSAFVKTHSRKLNDAIDVSRDNEFEYFGLKTVYDRYLTKHPKLREVIETPQYFFMRIACALSTTIADALELYRMYSSLECMPSSPTLFNAGLKREQLSSCFLVDSPEDSLEGIYDTYKKIAKLSKYAGGIGVAWSRVRSRGSLIAGTNGFTNGIIPWLKTLDCSVLSTSQGGRRPGACCVYLEPWHADVEEFLELRDETGAEEKRARNLNLANWIPDIFMRRVDADGQWSLFDPKIVPHFPDLYGAAFDEAYEKAESDGLAVKTMPARDLYAKMMRTLASTGNGWMTFKDRANELCNQTGDNNNVVHLSNLCSEILEVQSQEAVSVCNLASINLSRLMTEHGFNFTKLQQIAKTAIKQLDRVIDINFYTIDETKRSNDEMRPVGLGLMGLQDVFFMMGLPFDSDQARKLSRDISECIYFHALTASMELAKKHGPHPAFAQTRAAKGWLQFDGWGVGGSSAYDWASLRANIMKHGLRNSLLIAIAPTATIASIVGAYECIEPQTTNLFKRETLSGDFLQINKYLVGELKKINLWNEETRAKLKLGEGSIQGIEEIPARLKEIYRTAWEVPMKSLINMAAERGPFVDQSQSLNLFMESPTIGKLSSMYMYAWRSKLKTTYYLRSRPATKIAKVAAEAETPKAEVEKPKTEDSAAIACSLENPEACEACQ